MARATKWAELSPAAGSRREPAPSPSGSRSDEVAVAVRVHLVPDPRVGAGDSFAQGDPRLPADGFHPIHTEIAGPDADGSGHVLKADLLAGDFGDQLGQLVD